ncbi:glycosyltransferase family 2 protein [Erythrobacter aureus]|uniref:Glycosyltransferase family 2 protein n=1 Tax=Erythrobacter aureus TaxID=2182384 RepID=A0A345YIF5_9SPHN|nr:glycosyltransferase family 2 protein [Erythrobacter aureus]AXK43707.1 glycosyltransferase family 2 protein [Erythrobacter aureus]
MTMDEIGAFGANAVMWIALACFGVVVARNAVSVGQLLVAAWVFATRTRPGRSSSELWHRYGDLAMPVSVIAPAFNEELTITESVRALLALEYPEHHVIVVNDGSKDDTLGVLVRNFDMEKSEETQVAALQKTEIRSTWRSKRYPNLLVVDKENGRKADAANAGIGFAKTPLICVIDADSIIESDGLLRAAEPFMHDDGRVVAVGGTIRVANGCEIRDGALRKIGVDRAYVPRFQIVEYLRAFLANRVANAHTNTLMLISGAFGMFRRDVVIEVGGYRHDTVGEDLELVVRIHRHMREQKRNYAIKFIPDIVCWTEAPANLAGLKGQRARWQQGALETLERHKSMVFNPRYGRIGMIGMPQLVLEDVVGPPAEVAGYLVVPAAIMLGVLDPMMAAAYFGVTVLFGTGLSLGSLVLEESQLRRTASAGDLCRIGQAALLENFGYRQMNLIYRLRGIRSFLKKQTKWEAVPRIGFAKSE